MVLDRRRKPKLVTQECEIIKGVGEICRDLTWVLVYFVERKNGRSN
jgi:hypothetical protein